MDKPLDENADLDPAQLASLNSMPQAAEQKPPVQPPQPAAAQPSINRLPQPPASSQAAAAPAVPPAAEPVARTEPPKPPEQPKPAPLPPPDPIGPVALAPAVVYDADLDQHVSAPIAETPKLQAAPAQPDAVPQPSPSAGQRRPTLHSPAKGIRPVKVFSQSTKHVWKARRYQRQYAVFSIAMVILGAIGIVVLWVAIGSPTDPGSVKILGQ